jgi:hypothetical protein
MKSTSKKVLPPPVSSLEEDEDSYDLEEEGEDDDAFDESGEYIDDEEA